MDTKKGHFNDQLRGRTLNMAVLVHQLLIDKKVPAITRPIINQLIRCSSSVAANYRASTRSRSDAEFYSKVCIVVEEIDETQFWIAYLTRIGILKEEETSSISGEVDELVRLFTCIKSKMKEKLK